MKIKLLLALSFFCFFTVFSQKTKTKFAPIKVSYLDSIKATFSEHSVASKLDSLWLQEIASLDLYKNLQSDIENLETEKNVDFELPTDLLKARLQQMDEKSAFKIEYNVALENTIKSFLKNRKRSFEKLMGLSNHYFPFFEEALDKQNVPTEIKYLAIVESALNPKAVSKMGATGLWQFMYNTGKQYGLNIDAYVDDRCDTYSASAAAALYMKNMYKVFGDWDLVLASYNSGPGNVSKAIRRSGGKQSYWDIRSFLPKETQGYVPAFLATMYLFEFHKEHRLTPTKAVVRYFETDTIQLKSQMNFKQISDLLDMPIAQIQFLNPRYKSNLVPFSKTNRNYIKLPLNKVAVFTSNEDKIYAYINRENPNRQNQFNTTPKNTILVADVNEDNKEIIVSGKQKLLVNQIKKTRNLDILGVVESNKDKKSIEKIKLIKLNNDVTTTLKSNKLNTEITSVVLIPEKTTIPTHIVQKGETLRQIAKMFHATEADLQIWNNLETTEVNTGDVLKLGFVAFAKTDKPEVIYKNFYHEVKIGETIWTVARIQKVIVADIKKWNNLYSDDITGIKSLLILKPQTKVSDNSSSKFKEYLVQKGDTLIEIALKFPGISVQNLQKWNNINNKGLKPGMKLKISG